MIFIAAIERYLSLVCLYPISGPSPFNRTRGLSLLASAIDMTPNPPVPPPNGFERALKDFKSRLKESEKAKFKATTLDDLKVTILAIQSEQRSRKKMMHMGRIMSFLEAMEQFGKVIEIFLNVADMLAFIWGPVKLLLLVCL